MPDYSALFANGFATGAAIADRKKGRDLEARRVADEEVNTRIRKEQMDRVAQEFEMAQAVKRESLGRFVEASKGMDEFSKGASQIDWGASDATSQYEALTRQYLPSILKHEDVAKRWEIYNKTAMGNSRFTSSKLAEIASARALAEAAQIAPELAIDPPKKPDGSIDAEAFGQRLKSRREEMNAEAEKLRAISANRGGRRTDGMSAADKAEMSIIEDNIKEIDKNLNTADVRGNIRVPGATENEIKNRQLVTGQLRTRRELLINRLRQIGSKDSASMESPGEPFQSDGPASDATGDQQQQGRPASGPPDFVFDLKTGKLIPTSRPVQ